MPKNKGVAAPSMPFDPFSQELPRNVRFFEASQAEYLQISGMVDDPRMVITNIQKIENDTLLNAFEYKRAQRKDFSEHLMFHGTSEACADEISKNNFDWRLSGNNVGHKYGYGVNFSPSFKYAAWYSDKSVYERVMIGARVLIGRSCRGNPDMVVPPKGFDTTQNWDGRVIVKYEENEMVPVYKIYYHKHNYNNYYKNESENYFYDNQLVHDHYISFNDSPSQNGNFNRNNNYHIPNQRFTPYKKNTRWGRSVNKNSRWEPPVQNHGSFCNNTNTNGFNHISNNDNFVKDFCFANNNDQFVNNGSFVNQFNNRFNYNNTNSFNRNNRFNKNQFFVDNNRFVNNFNPFGNPDNLCFGYDNNSFL